MFEFDIHRSKKTAHPIMIENKVDAIPFAHEEIDTWRHNFTGVQYEDKTNNLVVFGAVDDIWVNKKNELIVVDYKATAKDREVSIESDWQIAYKRQMEIYQWLLRQNGFEVNKIGYFVYTNGRLDLDGFNNHLEFVTKLIPYTGDDSWVNQTLKDMKACLDSEEMPSVGTAAMGGPCEHCQYAKARTELTLDFIKKK